MTFESFEAEPKYVEPKSGFFSESPENALARYENERKEWSARKSVFDQDTANAKDAKKKYKGELPNIFARSPDMKKLFARFEAQGKESVPFGKVLSEATNEGKEFKNFMPYPGIFASREAKEQWRAAKTQ